MCDLDNLTEAQLATTSKGQMIATILRARRDTRILAYREGPHGMIMRQEETEDGLGSFVSRRGIYWTYYENGVTDEIRVLEQDARNMVLGGYVVKHYLDRQPTLLIIKPKGR